ncbi:FtsW/RodA/SpoVE family cell cycle protein [Bacillus spongiae]|uniref:Probable peptidoglycan glycosyltransferase FtsW n=1 Tax=Bacillus spongiae TaxID=2683610 RepID=A0ABU8HA41_9BACI
MFKKIMKSYDYSLIIVYALLCLFGVVMVYSASMVVSVTKYELPSDYFYQRQLLYVLVGFVAFCLAAVFPYKAFKFNKVLVPILILTVGSLFAVQLIGANASANNAQSWISLGGGFKIQPSEFAKLSIIIYLSVVYAKKQAYINDFNKGVAPPIAILIFICTLVIIQPDLGTATIIFAIGCSVILCSGVNIKTLFKLIGLAVVFAVLFSPMIWLKKDDILTEEKLGRIDAYFDPFLDPLDNGLQLINSYFAIGNGGIQGVGLGESIQKLGYLPEPHTDFIMAIISEELGLLGVSFVILGIGYIVLKGIYIGMKSKDPFATMLAVGISSMIGIQTFINLGGVSGLIPITGVPLPFISFGGSSLIVLSLSMGLLVNVSMFAKYEEKYKEDKSQKNSSSKIRQNGYSINA